MLRLTLRTEEYLMLGNNIKIAFLGGSHNHIRILVDAPKDVEVVRSTVLEKNHPELKDKNKYYSEPDLPERYKKKRTGSN